jgi:hypothetical protein
MAKTRRLAKIQRVELLTFYYISIFCPFCGSKVVDMDEENAVSINPCVHTLFVATDEGFEYRSARFNEALGINDLQDDEIDSHFGDAAGFDGITDSVDLPDAVKFAAYVGPPGGMGSYVGFAPLEE